MKGVCSNQRLNHRALRNNMQLVLNALDHSTKEEDTLVTQYTATHWTSKSISTAAAGIAPRHIKCTYYN